MGPKLSARFLVTILHSGNYLLVKNDQTGKFGPLVITVPLRRFDASASRRAKLPAEVAATYLGTRSDNEVVLKATILGVTETLLARYLEPRHFQGVTICRDNTEAWSAYFCCVVGLKPSYQTLVETFSRVAPNNLHLADTEEITAGYTRHTNVPIDPLAQKFLQLE